MNECLLSRARVAEFFGVTAYTVDAWRKQAKLPPPERLPNGRPAWRLSVLNEVCRRPVSEAA